MNPKPYSEEWWLRLDVRNALRKTVERSQRETEGSRILGEKEVQS